MTLDPGMLDLMEDTVTIEPFSSVDQYQAVTFGAAVTYRAQVLPYVERVIGPDGREVRSTAKVIVPDRLSIDPRSRITLPSGFNPASPPILGVRPIKGLGLDSTEILL